MFSFGATQPSEYMTQEVIAFVHVLSQYVLTKHSGQFEQSSLHTGMKSTLLHNIISKVLPPSRKTSLVQAITQPGQNKSYPTSSTHSKQRVFLCVAAPMTAGLS